MKNTLTIFLFALMLACSSQETETTTTVDAGPSNTANQPETESSQEESEDTDDVSSPAPDVAETAEVQETLPQAIVAPDRSGHWLDRPFPHEELQREDGTIDWTVLPPAPGVLGALMAAGWASQASEASGGTSHMPAVYFRFTETFELSEGDAGITGPDGTNVPVEWSWIKDPMGDVFLAPNTLVVMPQHTAPLASDTRYVAWVRTDAATAASDWTAPEGTPEDAIVATAFRTQDSVEELRELGRVVLAETADRPSFLEPAYFKKALSMTYTQGTTESGNASTLCVVSFEDGSTSTTFLGPNEGMEDLVVQLDESWPFEVWEAEISTLAFQTPQENKPWGSSGAELLNDFLRLNEGWIPFVDGKIAHSPPLEPMRIVIQVPREAPGPLPVLLWDHGTGGHAYNSVARTTVGDDFTGMANAISGAIVVSRDQPLYGQRYPLIDSGFGESLGFYNIGNLPAFRDNQRQGATDHVVLQQFVQQVLPELLADMVEIKEGAMGGFGHSLGSVTLHSALIAQQGADNAVKRAFMSGSGGYLTYYILSTGLLGTGHNLVDTLSPILGFTPEEVTEFEPHELIGAILGLPAEAWPNMDRRHPVLQVFGTIMDPSDPLMLAPAQIVPEVILEGIDDWQVPNETTQWLGEVLQTDEMIPCQKQEEYDGHYCTFREQVSFDALQSFIESL